MRAAGASFGARYTAPVLGSHRRHAPAPGVRIELDRALWPTWIVRRVKLAGVAHDERVTSAIGRGTADRRARLTIVLSGRLEVEVGERGFELAAGDLLLVPRIAQIAARGGEHEVLEIDWDHDAPPGTTAVRAVVQGRLGSTAREGARSIARALELRAVDRPEALLEAVRALSSEGLPLDPRGVSDDVGAGQAVASADDQRLMDALDATLSDLREGPAVVTLEDQLGWSRRTVSRRTTDLHVRYGLSGADGPSWRAMRDFYRILVGTVLASNPAFTTTSLASTLGYGSPEALCHAFANAGLPSPSSIPKVARGRGDGPRMRA